MKFELQGFRSIDRTDIAISASFTATVNAKLEVGSVTETITVTGESPTVDTKSNLQQTVMNQADARRRAVGPRSVVDRQDHSRRAGRRPTTSAARSRFSRASLSSHGSSTNDVSYNIDGASVNWPGGGGGATMLYYDQGMFEEVNYMTSAIPAEVMVGGVSINMVTKDAGNKWRGDARYNFSSGCLDAAEPARPGCLESDNSRPDRRRPFPTTFLGNPTKTDLRLQRRRRRRAGEGSAVGQRLRTAAGSSTSWSTRRTTTARRRSTTTR